MYKNIALQRAKQLIKNEAINNIRKICYEKNIYPEIEIEGYILGLIEKLENDLKNLKKKSIQSSRK